MPPHEWVKDAPPTVLSEMLAHGLSKGVFDAKLALEHLTPEMLAEHLSPPLVWKCIVEAAQKTFAPRRRAHAGVRHAGEGGGVDVGGEAGGDGRAPEPDRRRARCPRADSWEPNDVTDEEVIEETTLRAAAAGAVARRRRCRPKKKPAPAPVASPPSASVLRIAHASRPQKTHSQ